MKLLAILLLLFAFGCSHTEPPAATDSPGVKNVPSETLNNLVYVDMFAPSYTTQHPLIGRSVGGRDMAFRHAQSGKTIHAVFPKGVSAPDDLNGQFKLHGHYQTTAKVKEEKEASIVKKRIPDDYRYFIVSSWEHKK